MEVVFHIDSIITQFILCVQNTILKLAGFASEDMAVSQLAVRNLQKHSMPRRPFGRTRNRIAPITFSASLSRGKVADVTKDRHVSSEICVLSYDVFTVMVKLPGWILFFSPLVTALRGKPQPGQYSVSMNLSKLFDPFTANGGYDSMLQPHSDAIFSLSFNGNLLQIKKSTQTGNKKMSSQSIIASCSQV